MAMSKADEEETNSENNTLKKSSMPRIRSGNNLAALVVE